MKSQATHTTQSRKFFYKLVTGSGFDGVEFWDRHRDIWVPSIMQQKFLIPLTEGTTNEKA
jgi:hypothetical protein